MCKNTIIKIFADWFKKCSDGYISFHLVWIYQFPLPLIAAIHRIGNSPNILFPGSREQDESHPILHCIASCLNYTRVHIRGLINLNYTFDMTFKVSPKAKTIINGRFIFQFYDRIHSKILLTLLECFSGIL